MKDKSSLLNVTVNNCSWNPEQSQHIIILIIVFNQLNKLWQKNIRFSPNIDFVG